MRTSCTAVLHPAKASVLVRDLLTGPVQRATVVATGSMATYLDVDGRFLAVVAEGGVRLPCAAILGPGARPPAGPEVALGEGHVDVGSWFDPRVRVGPVDPTAVSQLAAALRQRPCPDPRLPADAPDRLAAALAGGDLDATVSSLLGRGSGLTPSGDDLLAGALATLSALDAPAARPLSSCIQRLAPGRTTRLSRALLDAAAVGAMIPEAEAVLRAPTGPAFDELIGVGHTSGWSLAAGMMVGLAA